MSYQIRTHDERSAGRPGVSSAWHSAAADHRYALFAAIARAVPTMHDTRGMGIHPIRGRLVAARALQLCPFSRLTFRVAAQHIPALLALAGKQLDVAGRHLRVGVPCVQALPPVAARTMKQLQMVFWPGGTPTECSFHDV